MYESYSAFRLGKFHVMLQSKCISKTKEKEPKNDKGNITGTKN